jgi:Trp operon repressor
LLCLQQAVTFESFTEDIDINDCRNRYLLTKSQTQQEIKKDTGADITTRGKYFPDRSKASAMDPPLHLHLSASTKEVLDKAVQVIREMMDREPDPLLSERASFAPRPVCEILLFAFVLINATCTNALKSTFSRMQMVEERGLEVAI